MGSALLSYPLYVMLNWNAPFYSRLFGLSLPEIAGFMSNWDSWNDHRLGSSNYGQYHIIIGSSTTTLDFSVRRIGMTSPHLLMRRHASQRRRPAVQLLEQ